MPLFVGCDIELAACVATEEAIRREGTRERVREWRKMARRREQERRGEQYHARREERNAVRRERDRAARSGNPEASRAKERLKWERRKLRMRGVGCIASYSVQVARSAHG